MGYLLQMADAQTSKPPTRGGQIWIVTYELRTEAIRIGAGNNGFFAPGQEPLWDFSAVQEWIQCVHEPEVMDQTAGGGRRAGAWWTRH